MVSTPLTVLVAVPPGVVVPTTVPLPRVRLFTVQPCTPPNVLERLRETVPDPSETKPSPENEPYVTVTLFVPVRVPVATVISSTAVIFVFKFQPPPTPVNCSSLKANVVDAVIVLPVVVAVITNVEEAVVRVAAGSRIIEPPML